QSGDTPHFQPGNLMDVLPKELNKKILSFSMVTFQYGMDPTGSMEEECRRQSQSSSQFRHLSCIAVSKSMGMRKNTKVRRQDPVVVVELHGEDDYVIFTHFPQSS
ncbi:MAG: hypothetical protein KDD25_10085, partial [Bdellovibrionales bacterium]|nr:hypothetical protein [Bdellovibrionales bacterium]